MIIKKGKIKGIFEINLEPHKDHRGFFMRTYEEKVFRNFGLHKSWVQKAILIPKKKIF